MKNRNPQQLTDFIRFAANLWADMDFEFAIQLGLKTEDIARMLRPTLGAQRDIEDYIDAVKLFRDFDGFFANIEKMQSLQAKREYFTILLNRVIAVKAATTDKGKLDEFEAHEIHYATLIRKVNEHIDSLN